MSSEQTFHFFERGDVARSARVKVRPQSNEYHGKTVLGTRSRFNSTSGEGVHPTNTDRRFSPEPAVSLVGEKIQSGGFSLRPVEKRVYSLQNPLTVAERSDVLGGHLRERVRHLRKAGILSACLSLPNSRLQILTTAGTRL